MANLPICGHASAAFLRYRPSSGRFSALTLDLFVTAEKRFFLREVAHCRLVAKADGPPAANGTTIVICSASTDAMNPFLYKRLPFHGRARLRQTQPAHLRDTYAGAAVK